MTTLARDEPFAAGVAARQVSAPGVSAEERLVEVAPMVRRVCRARLGWWDGDDAAQEVLLRLWGLQQRPEYSAGEPAALFGWAASNVRFQVLNTVSDRSRRVVPAGELAERLWVDPQAGPEEAAERRAAAREARDRLAELVPQLSLRERQVILASQFGARSNVETAARLGISREAAAVAKQNAIARMRELAGVDEPGSRAGRRAERYRESPEYRAAAARREAQQAALVAAAEQLPRAESQDVSERAAAVTAPAVTVPAVTVPAVEDVGGAVVEVLRGGWKPGRAGWPQEVHHAGRAALREGWNTEDVARVLGVGTNLVKLWRQTNAKDADSPGSDVEGAGVEGTGGAAGGSVSTAELVDRARRAVGRAQQRRSEVDAYARVFGAPRGRGGLVPEIVAEKAREAARRGWTPSEMERGFAVNRATAKRWIAEESASRAEPPEKRNARVEPRTRDRRAGRAGRVDGGDEAAAAESDTGRAVDPLVAARRAVEALPSPEQARVAVEEREQLHRAPAAVDVDRADDAYLIEPDADAVGDADGDAWSAA